MLKCNAAEFWFFSLKGQILGEKLVVFGHFFILSQTCPTVFFGLCWYHIEMCRMAIYKNVMRQNFVFYPQRSNIGVKIVVFSRFFILSRTRPTVFIGLCWYHIEMCRMAICKNVMRRNFDFFPQRSNIGVKSVVFWRFFILSRTRPTIFIGWCWYRI